MQKETHKFHGDETGTKFVTANSWRHLQQETSPTKTKPISWKNPISTLHHCVCLNIQKEKNTHIYTY